MHPQDQPAQAYPQDKPTFRAFLKDLLATETAQQDVELLELTLNEVVNIFPIQETIIGSFEAEGPDDHDGVEIYLAQREDALYLNLWFNPKIEGWVLLMYTDHTRANTLAILCTNDNVLKTLVDYMWGESS